MATSRVHETDGQQAGGETEEVRFQNTVAQIDAIAHEVLATKGKDYATAEDRTWNFHAVAQVVNDIRKDNTNRISPADVCMVYLVKHLVPLFQYARTGKQDSEGAIMRVVDAQNYLKLLFALGGERVSLPQREQPWSREEAIAFAGGGEPPKDVDFRRCTKCHRHVKKNLRHLCPDDGAQEAMAQQSSKDMERGCCSHQMKGPDAVYLDGLDLTREAASG